jgi:putative FmdB family regulatory protein
MPNFDFYCPHCEQHFELFHVPADLGWAHCPLCQTISKKAPSAPAFKVTGYAARNGYSNKNPWLQKGQG